MHGGFIGDTDAKLKYDTFDYTRANVTVEAWATNQARSNSSEAEWKIARDYLGADPADDPYVALRSLPNNANEQKGGEEEDPTVIEASAHMRYFLAKYFGRDEAVKVKEDEDDDPEVIETSAHMRHFLAKYFMA